MPAQKHRILAQVSHLALRFLAVVLATILLTACGGGGSSSTPGPDTDNDGGEQDNSGSTGTEDPFSSATILAGPAPKQITFSWIFNGTAAGYRLESNPDGISGYQAVDINGDGAVDGADELASDIEDLTLTLPLHLTDPLNMRYQLVAVDASAQEIARSDEMPLMQIGIESLAGYIKASNAGAGDYFGNTLALSADGNTLAVGAFAEDSDADTITFDGTGESDNTASGAGAVYVFVKADNIWSQQAYLKAFNSDAGDWFGQVLAISADGDTLAVGASSEASNATDVSENPSDENDNSAERAGAVYVFSRTDATWEQQAYIKASNTDAWDLFGDSIAISADGNTLVVGAWGESSGTAGIDANPTAQNDNSADSSGAAYVYKRLEALWSLDAYIKASNSEAHDYFGESVAISADGATISIGAGGESSGAKEISTDGTGENDNSKVRAGAVYLFRKDESGWSQEAYIKGSNTYDEHSFGSSLTLSIDGTTLAVTAISDDKGSNCPHDFYGVSTDGAVYVFGRTELGWSEQTYIKADNIDCNDGFGSSLSLSDNGDLLAIGSPYESSQSTGITTDGSGQEDNSAMSSGAVYLYEKSETSWSQIAYIKAPNTDSEDYFGRSTALSSDGNTLVIGASGEASTATGVQGDQQNDEADKSGAVYVY